MAQPAQKVEIGFDLTGSDIGPFFRLDDPVEGVLDNTEWLLGGEIFYDVTNYVTSVSITRGKNRELDQYDQGLANVVFNNNQRTFDPEYTLSPFAGQIVPKRQIRISSGPEVQFYGLIDDWNLTYEPNGDSIAAAACSDATASFALQTIAARTNSIQQSGERVNTILSLPEINWPLELRDIDAGKMRLGPDVIADNTNALAYFRLIEQSEPGAFFIGKNGSVVFRDRITQPLPGGVVLADDGSGIPYQSILVQYGSELLANEIVLSSAITTTQVSQTNLDSIEQFGIFNLTQEGLLTNDDADLEAMAQYFAQKYAYPEYRFDSVQILVDELTTQQQNDLLALELGDAIQIKFTPNQLPPAITKYAEVIRIEHTIDLENHILTLGFATFDFAFFVLDNAEFGKLDSGNALAF